MRMVRSLGANGSEAEGKEYMWMTVGTFSAEEKRSDTGTRIVNQPHQSERAVDCQSCSILVELFLFWDWALRGLSA